jgi:D-3-phosphoglycerate dehydrogenase
MPRVYVYDPVDEPIDWLLERGLEVTLGAPISSPGRSRPKVAPAELIAGAAGHDALLGASGALISREVMEGIGTLRCISKLGIGYEVIDVEAATDLGIVVTNTPVHGEIGPVAEHAVTLMLALLKQLHWYTPAYLTAGGWKDPAHMSGLLEGATVGIVGFGRIGRSVATRLQGWECRILAADPLASEPPQGVELVELPALLAAADIVTLHAPGLPAGSGPLLGSTEKIKNRVKVIQINKIVKHRENNQTYK